VVKQTCVEAPALDIRLGGLLESYVEEDSHGPEVPILGITIIKRQRLRLHVSRKFAGRHRMVLQVISG